MGTLLIVNLPAWMNERKLGENIFLFPWMQVINHGGINLQKNHYRLCVCVCFKGRHWIRLVFKEDRLLCLGTSLEIAGGLQLPYEEDQSTLICNHALISVLSLLGGVMKSCSYKSFCSQANSQGYRAPGVKVHCCYSDDCNVAGHATRNTSGFSFLLGLLLFVWHLLSN